MSWTDQRVEMLQKLWQEGLSASQIAAQLSHGITRNAVIGKIHRLGLSNRVKPAGPSPVSQLATRMKPLPRATSTRSQMPAIKGNTALAIDYKAVPAPSHNMSDDVVVPISKRVTIMELKESMCRWPLGDPSSKDFRFCGTRSPGSAIPYCEHHARIAYQPTQDRRRDKDKKMLRFG